MIVFLIYALLYCFAKRKPTPDMGLIAFIIGVAEIASSTDYAIILKILGAL